MNVTAIRNLLKHLGEQLRSPLYDFERTVRPDNPAEFDQQTSAYHSRAKVTFIRGGTGSGKTHTLAAKCAKFITQIQEPPRVDTPFVVISDTFEQVANICWKEKLSQLIPKQLIDETKCRWMNRGANWPYAIALKPWPNGNNWILEFHSLEQGRRSFQGRSFGGFWFSEQFEWDVFDEVVGRCRETWYDGAHFAEFTPLDADLAIGYEERMGDLTRRPPGWVEYRLNVFKNLTISDDWRESYFGSLSDEVIETRRTGELLHLADAIYKNFNPAVHVLNNEQWARLTGKAPPLRGLTLIAFKRCMPNGMFYRRGIDWGESREHPFAVVWGMKDGAGTWYIYDEWLEDKGTVLYPARLQEIVERYPWSDTDPHFGFAYCDPSRPLMMQQFMNGFPEQGIPGIPCAMASNAVDEGIEYVRNLLQPRKINFNRPRLYILDRCQNLIKYMRKYRYLISRKPGTTADRRMNPTAAALKPLKWMDDLPDALRYMLFSDRAQDSKPGSAIGYDTSSSRYGLHLDNRDK